MAGWWSILSPPAWAATVFIYCFYHVANATMQLVFYGARGGSGVALPAWKLQPAKSASVTRPDRWWPWFPACSRKPGRHPLAPMLATVNTVLAALFAGATTEAVLRGVTHMYGGVWESPLSTPGVTWWTLLWEFMVAVVHEDVVEYYWHRAMHTPILYRAMHKLHHHNKAPEPFDDMLIHPVEAIGYYCILYSPPFLYRMHVWSFLAYMGVMGITGVLDHCGVAISLPGVYHTADHDRHHEKFVVNYGFPFPWLDILHGTYDGVFWGRRYTALADRQQKGEGGGGTGVRVTTDKADADVVHTRQQPSAHGSREEGGGTHTPSDRRRRASSKRRSSVSTPA